MQIYCCATGHKYAYMLLSRTDITQRKRESSNDNLIPDGLVIIPTHKFVVHDFFQGKATESEVKLGFLVGFPFSHWLYVR